MSFKKKTKMKRERKNRGTKEKEKLLHDKINKKTEMKGKKEKKEPEEKELKEENTWSGVKEKGLCKIFTNVMRADLWPRTAVGLRRSGYRLHEGTGVSRPSCDSAATE